MASDGSSFREDDIIGDEKETKIDDCSDDILVYRTHGSRTGYSGRLYYKSDGTIGHGSRFINYSNKKIVMFNEYNRRIGISQSNIIELCITRYDNICTKMKYIINNYPAIYPGEHYTKESVSEKIGKELTEKIIEFNRELRIYILLFCFDYCFEHTFTEIYHTRKSCEKIKYSYYEEIKSQEIYNIFNRDEILDDDKINKYIENTMYLIFKTNNLDFDFAYYNRIILDAYVKYMEKDSKISDNIIEKYVIAINNIYMSWIDYTLNINNDIIEIFTNIYETINEYYYENIDYKNIYDRILDLNIKVYSEYSSVPNLSFSNVDRIENNSEYYHFQLQGLNKIKKHLTNIIFRYSDDRIIINQVKDIVIPEYDILGMADFIQDKIINRNPVADSEIIVNNISNEEFLSENDFELYTDLKGIIDKISLYDKDNDNVERKDGWEDSLKSDKLKEDINKFNIIIIFACQSNDNLTKTERTRPTTFRDLRTFSRGETESKYYTKYLKYKSKYLNLRSKLKS